MILLLKVKMRIFLCGVLLACVYNMQAMHQNFVKSLAGSTLASSRARAAHSLGIGGLSETTKRNYASLGSLIDPTVVAGLVGTGIIYGLLKQDFKRTDKEMARLEADNSQLKANFVSSLTHLEQRSPDELKRLIGATRRPHAIFLRDELYKDLEQNQKRQAAWFSLISKTELKAEEEAIKRRIDFYTPFADEK